MRKSRGDYLIELYDELGSKTDTKTAEFLNKAQEISDLHCKKSGYSAVILRVIVNTKQQNSKQEYRR